MPRKVLFDLPFFVNFKQTWEMTINIIFSVFTMLQRIELILLLQADIIEQVIDYLTI